MNTTTLLSNEIVTAVAALGLETALQTTQQPLIPLERPADSTHGDFATTIALSLFGRLGNTPATYTSPRQLAQALAEQLKSQNISFVSDITVAGPGFINFTLSDAFLLSKIGLIVQNSGDVIEKFANGKKVVAEYSSPNIAKPFTVGHLRSTIIGDSLANIFEACGYTVFRDNHLGDWGTQFGKQIYAIKTWGDEKAIENSPNPVKELVALYVKFHQEAELDPSLEDEGRAWFTRLEKGDPEARRLWKKCIDWSWTEFEKIYQKLGVNFTENNGLGYGESFFEDKMDVVIQELKTAGLLQESEGAQLVFFPEEKYPPLMITKKDGSTLYSTRDLATDKFRLEKYGSDIIIFNEVGAEQSLYFKQLFEIEHMLGWYQKDQRVHVGHGLIRFQDKKMSTRKGNVIWLDDVLAQAYERVSGLSADLDEAAKWKIAVGALKWNDLKRTMHIPMIFDWDELTNIKGNSGPYMQYTYVRCMSVLQKADSSIASHFDTLLDNKIYLNSKLNVMQRDLLRNLCKYSDVVELAAKEYAPHHIPNYLYELAQSFNSLYGNQKIITDDAEATQLQLLIVKAVADVIHHGLGLLGIETLEKM